METPASRKPDVHDPTILDATAVTVELGHLWSEISKLKKDLEAAQSERRFTKVEFNTATEVGDGK